VETGWVSIVGFLAATASTISFSPQAWKIIKSRDTEGLSSISYAITATAFALWLAYGVMLGSWPLILSNGICLALSSFILVMTLLPQSKKERVASSLDPES
jgi:MtN3 and saliva related transmembrane protein